MRSNLDIFESIYTYDDLKRIAIYTRNDERDLQEMVCKDFLEDTPCTFSTINIYIKIREQVQVCSQKLWSI